MSNRIKEEMKKIYIPKTLHERSKFGVMSAKSRMKKPKLKWSYLTASVIAAVLAIAFISYNSINHLLPNKSSQNSEGQETSSYIALLKINGDLFRFSGEGNHQKYTINSEIGKTQKKVSPKVIPQGNFVSNYLEKGTLIYSVKEDPNILVVQTKGKDIYKIFKKQSWVNKKKKAAIELYFKYLDFLMSNKL